jgi:hypothetical protein
MMTIMLKDRMKAMTDDQIKALAIMDGWEFAPERVLNANFIAVKFGPRCQQFASKYDDFSYLLTHNVIIPLIVKWCGDKNGRWRAFQLTIAELCSSWSKYYSCVEGLLRATPEELAEALVRTMEYMDRQKKQFGGMSPSNSTDPILLS